MPEYKVSYLFNSGRYGWSESFYTSGSDHESVMTKAKLVGDKRRPMLGYGNYLECIRVSDILIPFDARRQFYYASQGVNANVKDAPWSGWLVELRAGALYKRPHLIRGVPDEWIAFSSTNPNIPIENSVFTGLLQQWIEELKTQLFAIRSVSKEPPHSVPRNVTAVMSNPDEGDRLKLLVNTADLSMTEEFRLKGFKHPMKEVERAINKVWKPRAFDATSVTIELPWQNIQLPDLLTLGTLTRRVFVLTPILSGTHLWPAKRDTGRAFFVSAGRRPARP